VILPKRPYINHRKDDGDHLTGREKVEGRTMFRILKLLFFLLIIGFIALIGYAYLGDLSPDRSEVVEPVTLDEN
ncbi:hypothetical protein LCGC14_2949480, partial [marine sediment metagenome]